MHGCKMLLVLPCSFLCRGVWSRARATLSFVVLPLLPLLLALGPPVLPSVNDKELVSNAS
jgi:hypothetical protein